ncbi:hypothetical protein C8T65DRAFT_728611 [Cerioporus squamosus]|nr:hypothetical protein C8T65DRAFT_728611 [Cerioporus squamosus]
MPEVDVLKAIEHNLRTLIDNYPKKNDGLMLLGHWKFFFRCHAVGTKTKSYDTLTWTSLGYDPAIEEPLDRMEEPKPIHSMRNASIASRGKELVIAAGYHAVRIHLGLEASVFVVSLEDFYALTEHCRPGPNKNKAKAKRLRSFALPSRFVVPGSPAAVDFSDRYINIFAAVVCQDCAILVTDFARLVRLHVLSRSQLWMDGDLTVGSQFWSMLWDEDHGPDWANETGEAMERVAAWRSEVVAHPNARAAQLPIIVSLYAVQTVFNGLGKHTANDLLHLVGLWPGMPTIQLCADKPEFDRFLDVLVRYMALWSSDHFLEVVAPPANHPNPFAFNYRSHRNYISRYVHVYRKSFVNVSPDFYNQLASSGLLDQTHTIGDEFDSSSIAITELRTRSCRCTFISRGSVKFYSVIRARRPESWHLALNDQLTLAPDMRRLANNTTVGIASFREMVENVQDVSVKWKPGRKKTHRTGKPGRPYKNPRKRDIQKGLQVVSGYMHRIRAQLRALEEEEAPYGAEDSDTIPDEDPDDVEEDDSDTDTPLSTVVLGKRKQLECRDAGVGTIPLLSGRVTRSRTRAAMQPKGL